MKIDGKINSNSFPILIMKSGAAISLHSTSPCFGLVVCSHLYSS